MKLHSQRGFSLLELLITVSVVAILVAVGAPAVLERQQSMRLSQAVQDIYFTLQFARSSAISDGNNVTVHFNEGANWCVGVSDAGVCDCSTADSCTVNGIEHVTQLEDYSGITMQELSFGANDSFVFDSMQGLSAGQSGSTVLTDGEKEVRLELSTLGRVKICMEVGELGNYQACP